MGFGFYVLSFVFRILGSGLRVITLLGFGLLRLRVLAFVFFGLGFRIQDS